ncbi:MAG: FtsX-like permease family protein, partial [Gemmatimonadaceae bacterium]
TLDMARAELTSLVRGALMSAATSPSEAARYQSAPVPVVSGAQGFSVVRRSFRSALVTLQAGVGVLLLIACTNLASLALARAAARGPEMSLRMALGAARRRLVRQMMTESGVVGALGALLGLAAAWWGSRALVAAATTGGAAVAARISWPVLAFTLAISVGATLFFGLVPAFQASRSDVASPIRSLGRTVGSGRGAGRTPVGRLLVPLQVALSLVLLTGTALLARGLQRMETASMGLDRDHLLIATLDPARQGINGPAFLALADQLTTRIGALPGVQAVTYSQNGLFAGNDGDALAAIPGFTGRKSADSLLPYDLVGPGYAKAIGATVLHGRDLDARDAAGQAAAAVVNESAERFYFGGGNAVGRVIYFDAGVPTTIVGVIADVRDHSLGGPAVRRAYASYAQQLAETDAPALVLEIRTRGDPKQLVAPVRAAITSVTADVPIVQLNPLSERVRESIRQERLVVSLAFGFGLAALLLAAVGLYGVMSYAVTRRTGEIGLRTALGASRGAVVRLVLRDGLRLVALGVGAGIPAAWVAARALRSQLHDLPATDPVSMAVALGVLVVCATVAALVPAVRASRVAPAVALTSDR